MLSLEFWLSCNPDVNPSASSAARERPLQSEPPEIALPGPFAGGSTWMFDKGLSQRCPGPETAVSCWHDNTTTSEPVFQKKRIYYLSVGMGKGVDF